MDDKLSIPLEEMFNDLPDPPWHVKIWYAVSGWIIVEWCNFKGRVRIALGGKG